MNSGHEPNATPREAMTEPEAFTEAASATIPTLEPDVSMESERVFDEDLLAAVPYALDAWMSHQCFGHC